MAIGPSYPVPDDGLHFDFSPDGTMVFLVRTGSTRIIDVATGRTTDLPGDGLEVSGWQRLAP